MEKLLSQKQRHTKETQIMNQRKNIGTYFNVKDILYYMHEQILFLFEVSFHKYTHIYV